MLVLGATDSCVPFPFYGLSNRLEIAIVDGPVREIMPGMNAVISGSDITL